MKNMDQMMKAAAAEEGLFGGVTVSQAVHNDRFLVDVKTAPKVKTVRCSHRDCKLKATMEVGIGDVQDDFPISFCVESCSDHVGEVSAVHVQRMKDFKEFVD